MCLFLKADVSVATEPELFVLSCRQVSLLDFAVIKPALTRLWKIQVTVRTILGI